MSTAVLDVTGLSAGYHSRQVIEGVDITVNAGQIVALVGANGAGKTTTLRTLAGELTPLAGSITFLGSSKRESLSRRARRGLGYVTEERSISPSLTTMANLRISRGDIDMALELFPELRPLLKRTAGLLSGGEQQMLGLARALSRRPKLLLADELSLGLAPLVVNRLLSAVRAAADTGLAVVLVEQHVHKALELSDYVLVMRRGRIVARGTPAQVQPQLRDAYLTSSDEQTA